MSGFILTCHQSVLPAEMGEVDDLKGDVSQFKEENITEQLAKFIFNDLENYSKLQSSYLGKNLNFGVSKDKLTEAEFEPMTSWLIIIVPALDQLSYPAQ